MANSSIYAAFERMWQHVVAKLGDKADTIHEHNDIYYTKTESDSKVSELSEAIAELPQADWNQNDETAPDYVKNRLAWESDPIEVVLMEETELTFVDGFVTLSDTIEFVVGRTYVVYYDGTTYTCTAYGTEVGHAVIGNGEMAGLSVGNGEPFVAIIGDGMRAMASTDASATVKITEILVEAHTIDKKYLPHDIPYMQDNMIPNKYIQIQIPSVKDVFGTTLLTGSNSLPSTLDNPYPNKYIIKELSIETFKSMLDGSISVPNIIAIDETFASVSVNQDGYINVRWNRFDYFYRAGGGRGVNCTFYDANIREDTDNPGTIVSEWGRVELASTELT